MSEKYTITINNKLYEYSSTLDKSLLDYLRGDLHLMGSKNGCGNGQCGACTVIINNKAKRSCLAKMSKLNGSNVETIEGLVKNGVMHPLQISFINCGAIQCGFCTPGMIMSAKALLDTNQNPSREDINKALAGNICRCTGYNTIIEAIQMAAKSIRENKELTLNLNKSGLDENVIRKDGIDKALGNPIFSDDLPIVGSLYGELALSKYACANILSIDTSECESVEGVERVITYKDIPGVNVFGIISRRQPILAYDKVRFMGDPIALILAKDKVTAQKASKLIKVQYDELTPNFDMTKAENNKVKLYEDGNILKQLKVDKGNVEAGFKESDIIIEETIKVPFIEHAYLEPDSVYSYYEDGMLTVSTQSQSSFAFRDDIAASLNLDVNQVRVITNATGGAFGGREEPTVQVHAALGTLITGKPVHMAMDRNDVMLRTIKRHAEIMQYKIGAKKNGKITALEVHTLADTGAYPSAGEAVILRSVLFASGPYCIENAHVEGKAVYTNNVPCGAMRGFGSNQPAIAMEIIMDELAIELKMDPIELRIMNSLVEGSKTLGGQILRESVGIKPSLEILRNKLDNYKIPIIKGKKVGIGIASGTKNVGLGSGMNDKAGAIAQLKDDHLLLSIASVDSGQGSDTVARQIGAKEFNCNLNNVEIIANDTKFTIDSGVTTASRQTYVTGNAVLIAVNKLKDNILSKLIKEFNVNRDEIEFKNNYIFIRNEISLNYRYIYEKYGSLASWGNFYSNKTVPLSENGDNPFDLDDEFRLHFAYDFGSQAAVVAVDEETGKVDVLKIFAVHDAGKVINKLGIKGQIEGGIVMGMGYALSESFVIDAKGVVTNSFKKIGVPTIKDAPEIEYKIIENTVTDGPYGAKGIGEITMVPTTPAIINAIYNAIGVRITSLPAKAEKIIKGIREQNDKL